MRYLGFIAVRNERIGELEIKLSGTKVFKKLDSIIEGGCVYLVNGGIDAYDYELKDEDYFCAVVDDSNIVSLYGNWISCLEDSSCAVTGSMTFVIAEMDDEDHYYQLRDFYGCLWVRNNYEVIESFISKGAVYVDTFVEKYGSVNSDDTDVNRYWELFDELHAESGEDYDSIVNTLKISYAFNALGIHLESDDEKRTHICTLNGIVPLNEYLKYKDILDEEMEELENGDSFKFAYSLWSRNKNVDLFTSLGIDNGDYLSYPTLTVGEFTGEPETGHWY